MTKTSLFDYYLMKSTKNPTPEQKTRGSMSRLSWLVEQVQAQESREQIRKPSRSTRM